MKPNFKKKQQLVKVTFNGHNNNFQKKVQPKNQQEQQSPCLDQSLVGQRHFIFLDNKSMNKSQVKNAIEQNISLTGESQKVYFTNASTMNKQELLKDKKIYQEINAFKPSQKLSRESNQDTFKKNKQEQKYKNTNQQLIEEDDNEFLELNQVGKWQKGNKSTVISEEMKKLNTQLQHRLTETKWAKKKPINKQQQNRAKTQKNRSTSKNDSIKIKQHQNKQISDFNNNQSKNISNLSQKHQNASRTFKKQTEKLLDDISPQNKAKLSSMTSWKEPQKKQEEIQQQQNNEEQQQNNQENQEEESSEEEQEQQQQSEEQSQEEEEEQVQDEQEQDQQDEDQSSGQEGWDQPEQETPEDEQQEEQNKQDPFNLPQNKVQQPSQIKAKKWGSSRAQSQVNQSTANNKSTASKAINSDNTNPSIKIQPHDKKEQNSNKQQEQIQDLTQGEIQNEQVDHDWQKLQKVLLRIQKLVN